VAAVAVVLPPSGVALGMWMFSEWVIRSRVTMFLDGLQEGGLLVGSVRCVGGWGGLKRVDFSTPIGNASIASFPRHGHEWTPPGAARPLLIKAPMFGRSGSRWYREVGQREAWRLLERPLPGLG
jgi:hypothetical protein